MGDIAIAVGLCLLTAMLSYMGFRVTLHPPRTSRGQRVWQVGFVAIALVGCALIGWQTKRNNDSQQFFQAKLSTIEGNTEHPQSLTVKPPQVTVNPTPVIVEGPKSGRAELQFTFLPLGPNEEALSTVSKSIIDGAVPVEITAKNIGAAQANNGQIWIQLCDGCKFAEEPAGSTMPPDDRLVRRKIFEHLHMGVYFEPTLIKVIPPTGTNTFTITLKYACEECAPVDNQHPQKLRVNIIPN
jgi:hypothetical protein